MAYQKVPRPSTVYHLTQKGNLDRILDDGRIRRFSDTECWFCESLDTMRAYMEQTVMCKGKTYRTADGQLCHYSNFNPEAHILLKLAPIRQEDAWYRRTQDQPSSSSDEMMQEEREFFPLSIGYRGDMAFQNAEVIDVPKFLAGEIVSHKELTSNELWGLIFERTEAEMAAYIRYSRSRKPRYSSTCSIISRYRSNGCGRKRLSWSGSVKFRKPCSTLKRSSARMLF